MNNSPTDQGNGVFLAHVREIQAGYWEEHILEEHLQAVAQLADQFASVFGSGDWARLAGLWHDLGKYRPAFQHHIRSASGYDPDAHIETARGKVDHATAGAIYACKQLGLDGRVWIETIMLFRVIPSLLSTEEEFASYPFINR